MKSTEYAKRYFVKNAKKYNLEKEIDRVKITSSIDDFISLLEPNDQKKIRRSLTYRSKFREYLVPTCFMVLNNELYIFVKSRESKLALEHEVNHCLAYLYYTHNKIDEGKGFDEAQAELAAFLFPLLEPGLFGWLEERKVKTILRKYKKLYPEYSECPEYKVALELAEVILNKPRKERQELMRYIFTRRLCEEGLKSAVFSFGKAKAWKSFINNGFFS